MSNRFRKLFSRNSTEHDAEPLGEDMVPSPLALAERSALSTESTASSRVSVAGPFTTSAPAPMRDATS